MEKRLINGRVVSAIGLGCMNVNHAYGAPPSREQALALIETALDSGVDFFDTAALYGFGENEKLVGQALKPHREKIFLASKCGMTGVRGRRVIDGRPETLKKTCEDSLRNLQTDCLDLYYLHRWDKSVPIEDSVGALSDLVRDGKIKSIGLSEVSAATLRKAHAVHAIAAVQTEYSLWTRNPEIKILATCADLNVAFVAFSPLARGYLTGKLTDVSTFAAGDIRRNMPRFSPENYARNLSLLPTLRELAEQKNCTMAQLSLAWLLSKGDHVIPIPGTRSLAHLEENRGALDVSPGRDVMTRLEHIFTPQAIAGARYPGLVQAEIDTEEF